MTNEVRVNPLLEKIKIPGETFALPSRGIFYTNGELDPSVKNGEVYIQPMTTGDEMLMHSPDLLFSGEALYGVIEHCVPQIKQPKQLLAKDVDYILVCLRKVSYGPMVEINWKHDCEKANTHSYEIKLDHFLKNTVPIDATTVNVIFKEVLPNDQIVYFNPPRIYDMLQILQSFTEDNNRPTQLTPEQQRIEVQRMQDRVISGLLGVINKVDDTADKELIKQWLLNIPAGWVVQLNKRIAHLSDWGTDFKINVQCKDCGATAEVDNQYLNPVHFFI